jgi:transposase-like protein
MAKKGRRTANEERLIAVRMHKNWMSAPRIAEIMNVGLSTVFSWIDKYRRGGLAAISTKAASIAVGTALAGGPPRRSQRALLTHWAPALSGGVKARVGEGVFHAGGW